MTGDPADCCPGFSLHEEVRGPWVHRVIAGMSGYGMCPHPTVLNLPQARLLLYALKMIRAHQIRKLETMCLSSIWFEQPWHSMRPDKMHNIVEEWQRIFPRPRALPCTADILPAFV